jgi:Co/Zn/Cd efflux system component
MNAPKPRACFALRALTPEGHTYKRVMGAIATGILVFAAIQCGWALAIGSRQLLKDGLDWGYDVLLNGIAAFVFGRGVWVERASAFVIAMILAVAGLHTLYDLWDKINTPRPIEITTIAFSAVSATGIAYLVVGALWRFRDNPNPLIQATWLSGRNDAISTTFASMLVMLLRLAPLRWPEYVSDLVFAGLSFQATWAILKAERNSLKAEDTTGAVPCA